MLFSLCCSYEPKQCGSFLPDSGAEEEGFCWVCVCVCVYVLFVCFRNVFLMLNGMFYVAHEFHLNVFFNVLIRMFSFASSLFGYFNFLIMNAETSSVSHPVN